MKLCRWFFVAASLLGLASCGRSSPADWPPSPPGEDRGLLKGPNVQHIHFLPQNWSDATARQFYETPQGSEIIPYTWFVNLEQGDSAMLFRAPEHMSSLGYLPRSPEPAGNPDGLPVGFVRDGAYVGLTCAACHTGEITYRGSAWLIDGGPTLGDAEMLLRDLEKSLAATQADAAKFARFAKGVLGGQDNVASRAILASALAAVITERSAFNKRNLPKTNEPRFGPGRVDAFGGILNEVAITFARETTNEAKADAPVSYPFLWDTPQHDFVQWNGAAKNLEVPTFGILPTPHIGALGRNVGEVLGVFGKVNTEKDPGLFGGYDSSINKQNLIDLEELVRALWSPLWPTELGEVDLDLKAKGKILYRENCVACHAIIDRKDEGREVRAEMHDVGTDETMARNVLERRGRSGVFSGRRLILPLFRKLAATDETFANLLSHVAQRVIIGNKTVDERAELPVYGVNLVIHRSDGSDLAGRFEQLEFANDRLIAVKARSVTVTKGGIPQNVDARTARSKMSPSLRSIVPPGSAENTVNFNFRNSPVDESSISVQYKARPLNGIWATAPYLHNGSVPNLEELLKPATQRPKTFHVGSREFDVEKVGLADQGEFLFDTTASPGNSNVGHDQSTNGRSERAYKRVFSPEERKQLIAFLKSLGEK